MELKVEVEDLHVNCDLLSPLVSACWVSRVSHDDDLVPVHATFRITSDRLVGAVLVVLDGLLVLFIATLRKVILVRLGSRYSGILVELILFGY